MTELTSEPPDTGTARRLDIPRALLEDSHEGIALIDADGVIQYANPAIDRVLGYATNESIVSACRAWCILTSKHSLENDLPNC